MTNMYRLRSPLVTEQKYALILSLSTHTHTLTFPLMLGSLDVSIFPTSHVIILDTGSKEYFPWLGVKVTFRTALGNGTSTTTFSTWHREHCLEEFVNRTLGTRNTAVAALRIFITVLINP